MGLTQDQEILDLLDQVEAARQVLVLVCLQLRLLMEATEVGQLCITEPTTEVEVAGLRVLPVHMAHLPRAEEAALLRQPAAATDLWAQPRHRHNQA